jgi:RNA-binding protein Tab2/Atab2
MANTRLPPLPLPENLWGDRWQFAALPAGELVDAFAERMIPILDIPERLLPLNLGLASSTPIPGVVISGARQALKLARWIKQSQPLSLKYIAGAPDGLILTAGLRDRWIVATFSDEDIATAARSFEQRKTGSQGSHFLLVQPDDSGMTYSGFWLLQDSVTNPETVTCS